MKCSLYYLESAGLACFSVFHSYFAVTIEFALELPKHWWAWTFERCSQNDWHDRLMTTFQQRRPSVVGCSENEINMHFFGIIQKGTTIKHVGWMLPLKPPPRHLKGSGSFNPIFFIADLPKTLLFHSRIINMHVFCLKGQPFWEISQKKTYACGAMRPQAFVFLANFSEMADLSGKRHVYSWMK